MRELIRLVSTAGTGYHYYTMNYIDGKSLAALLPLSIGQAGPIFVQALSGLARLHKEDIIHRDIKPSNIMLTLDDRALLCDLGKLVFSRGRQLVYRT